MDIKIGVIGGSGFYSLFEKCEEIKVETPYGAPSGKVAIGKIAGQSVAFLPRHSKDHDFPPHKINYLANLWALKSQGVERIITATAVGSLQREIKPGDFVVLDQFVDRTTGREDTFYNGPVATHVSTADPYCPQLAKIAFKIGKKMGLGIHSQGTVVVISGPRFSSRAESEWFSKMGWEIVNMTQYPEVTLARELAMCYCALALVTDYDAGIAGLSKIKPVTASCVARVFAQNNQKAQKLIYEIIKNWPQKRVCKCQKALVGARLGK